MTREYETRLTEEGQVIARLRWYDCSEVAASAYIDRCGAWHSTTGEPVESEWEEIGCVFLKRDGCMHIGLRDPDMDREWVHVCGPDSLRQVLLILTWAAAEAQRRIPSYAGESSYMAKVEP